MSRVGYIGGSEAGHTSPGEKATNTYGLIGVPPVEESRADPWTGFHRSSRGGNKQIFESYRTVYRESRG
jgi:hypothetical protein